MIQFINHRKFSCSSLTMSGTGRISINQRGIKVHRYIIFYSFYFFKNIQKYIFWCIYIIFLPFLSLYVSTVRNPFNQLFNQYFYQQTHLYRTTSFPPSWLALLFFHLTLRLSSITIVSNVLSQTLKNCKILG